MDRRARLPNRAISLAVHASAVEIGSAAWLFLGPSGTGKSTVCRLLEERWPSLAQDVVYLFPLAAGGWGVVDGGRRAYEEALPAAEWAGLGARPLGAVARLFQAAEPRLQSIGPLETCRYLADALFEIAWQREYDVATKKMIFAHLAAVARSVPGYELYFGLSPRTREVVEHAVS